MAVRSFIGVVHARQAGYAREAGIVAFSHGREAPVKDLSPGDRVVLYAPRTDFDGDPVQAFVAHAVVTGDAPYIREFPMGEGWCRDASYDDVTPAPVRPMLEDLSFVKDPRYWGMAFRRGKFEISEADYRTIATALEVQP
ncbi:EVE domain-containing protein [Psychromarinibacter sp. S121]|uniref:EVE domain-containing protein n=1 Tax=Psychromarinibacter sp. S121 TaxID=3415127 RepID=UPI003C7C0213